MIILGAITFLVALIAYDIWDYQNRLNGIYDILYYYALPVALLIPLLIASRLQKYKINVALALSSAAVTRYASEGILTFLPALSRPYIQAVEAARMPIDKRSRLDVVEDLAAEGVKASPLVAPWIWARSQPEGGDIMPLGGKSNALTVYCNVGSEDGAYVLYQSDEHGFNNPKGLHGVDSLDIAAVGDSFTQGHCVLPENNAVAMIRNTYENTLNLGMNNNGPLMMLATLEEYAAPLEPRIVLWFYFEGNDLAELDQEKRSGLLMAYLGQGFGQNLLSMQPEIDRKLEEFVEQQKQKTSNTKERHPLVDFVLVVPLRGILRSISEKRPDNQDGVIHKSVDFDLFRRVLASAKDTTSSWGGELYFVYLPEWQRFNDPGRASPYHDQVLHLVDDLGIPIIDISETFAARDDPLALFTSRVHYHYGKEGYRLVAETVLQHIERGE